MWTSAAAYERFMGGWSREVARSFLPTLEVPPAASWLDVGCGVGNLTDAIVSQCAPSSVVAVEPSLPFLQLAKARLATTPEVRILRGTAENLPLDDATVDVAASGLVLNFLPDPDRALREMVRVTRPGGRVAVYVWDYDYPDFFLTRFWDAVAHTTVDAAHVDERGRWPLCSRQGLLALGRRTGLVAPRARTIHISTDFASADELWDGFLLGVGPSGSLAASLPAHDLKAVRTHLDAHLPATADGTVHLTAAAIALDGSRAPD